MTELIRADSFADLLRNRTALLDVRSPIEFQRGALPTATNIPLLTDPQREKVGSCYRQHGRESAIALGHELVNEPLRESLLQQWQSFFAQHPEAALYCWRGGLRSSTVQQWLAERGICIPRIEGGFKALRHHLLETIADLSSADNLVIVAGKTGSGKTHFINDLGNSLDLEGLANHRGSAFGKRVAAQPAQIDFENALGLDLLHLDWTEHRRVVLEDESRAIGSLSIPLDLHQRMLQSPIALIEETLQRRIDTIHLDYIQSNYQDFRDSEPEQAEQLFADSLCDALFRIRKRLGLERYQRIRLILEDALQQQRNGHGIDAHHNWIEELLRNYYDPMYEYQLQKKSSRIVFRGDREETRRWIQSLNGERT